MQGSGETALVDEESTHSIQHDQWVYHSELVHEGICRGSDTDVEVKFGAMCNAVDEVVFFDYVSITGAGTTPGSLC